MSGITPNILAAWREYVGRQSVDRQHLELESLRRYAVAVDANIDVERELPPLAHWAFFLPTTVDEGMGEDGHARRGAFLPPITLARRMFAAATIDFLAPLLIAEKAELSTTIKNVAHKVGASGDLIFVEVERHVRQRGVVRIREDQHYVYRETGAPVPMPQPLTCRPAGELWQPDAVNLFRFSAATFNAHRIHYDAAYAVCVEQYPALVIHGPFAAAKLAALAQRDGPLARFTFRANAPLFLGQPVSLQKRGEEVLAVRCDGVTAMTAQSRFQQ